MRWLIAVAVASILIGCGGWVVTRDQCRMYVGLAKAISVQIANDVDRGSPEDLELRERWAEVGRIAAEAGCEHIEEPEE